MKRTLFTLLFSLLVSPFTHAEDFFISAKEAETLIKNGAVLVDVREVKEAEEGMAAPAQLIPLSKIDANDPEWQKFLGATPKDKTIVTYCRSGRRSGIVTKKLIDLGYKVKNLGGFDKWAEAKLPTKKYSK